MAWGKKERGTSLVERLFRTTLLFVCLFTLRRHQQIDVLEDVQEELISPILDAFPSPADLPGHLRGNLRLLLLGGRLHPLLGDEGLQNAGVGVLRVAKVEDLIEELVDQHKVVLHVLLADLAEVALHDVAHLQEELEDHRRGDVLLGDGGQPKVASFDVEERGSGEIGHRGANLLASVDDVDAEGVHGVSTDRS